MDYDALERLVKLRDQKVLTDDEFAEQKRILLIDETAEDHRAAEEEASIYRYTLLQKLSALSMAVGLCAVVYSTFIYDTTISPMDVPSTFTSVDESSSFEDRADAIREINERYDLVRAGVRVTNFQRVETQQSIFSSGALLMLLGAIGFGVHYSRRRR